MKGKVVVITGANSGIGKQAALELAAMGAHIVMVCRNQEKGKKAIAQIKSQQPEAKLDLQLCDLSSQSSIKESGLRMRKQYAHIDVLLNNAGAMFGEKTLSVDGLESTFALDHMGYFLFTHYLLDLVKKGEMKRIVNVSSDAHRFVKQIDWNNLQGEKSYSEFGNYGLAKLFNIYFTRKLAQDLQKDGITVNALHPGFVDTSFGSGGSLLSRLLLPFFKIFAVSPAKGAADSVYLSSSPAVNGITGKYFTKKAESPITSLAKDEVAIDRLWQLSLELGKIDKYGQVNS